MKPVKESLRSFPELYERFRRSFRDKTEHFLSHPEVARLKEEYSLPDAEFRRALPEIRHWLLEKGNCRHCRGLEFCKNIYRGHFPEPHMEDGRFYFTWKACSYQETWQRQEKQRRLLRSHLIPQEALKVSFSDLVIDEGNQEAVNAALLYCRQFPHTGGRGIYLYGRFGVGKTYIMGAVAGKLTEKGWSVYFVHVPAFLREMKQAMSDNTLMEKMRELEEVDCLILDDLGAENLTAWARDEILGPLIQYRALVGKPILYTSNLSPELLEEHLAAAGRGETDQIKSLRIMDRIRHTSDIYFVQGRNRRRAL